MALAGLNSWTGNSEIIHAVASDPEGPYTYQSTVLPTFSHGPSVGVIEGGYVLFQLGCGKPYKPFVTGCSNGTSPNGTQYESLADLRRIHAANSSSLGCGGLAGDQFDVGTMLTDNLDGPWTPREQVKLSTGDNPTAQSWHKTNSFCNPAPLRRGSASNNSTPGMMIAYRAASQTGGEMVSVAVGTTRAGPFVDNRTASAVTAGGEDP